MNTPSNPSAPQISLAPAGWDQRKRTELRQSRRLATALLLFATAVYLIALLLEPAYPWLYFVQRTAEAAMIGGLADWFAVTALFRHPLGLPIPHTAIIPRRKDDLGASLGTFVRQNFLTEEVVAGRVRRLGAGQRVADWLALPANGARVADYALVAVAGAVQVARDDEVQAFIERSIVERVRAVPAAPLAGHLLAVALEGPRRHTLLHELLGLLAQGLSDYEPSIRRTISRSKPWWILVPIDDAVYQRLIQLVRGTQQELVTTPDHPLYARFDQLLDRLVADLQQDPQLIAKGEGLKDELLDRPVVRDVANAIWADLRGVLLGAEVGPHSPLRVPIERGIDRLAATLQADEALRAKIDGWAEEGARFLVRMYGHEAQGLIAETVRRWNGDEAATRMELAVGKELQYIRINGTLVGGLAGLLLALFAALVGRL